MFENVVSFIDRHQSFVLTTHDYPDADGLGAELVFASILEKAGKTRGVINSSDVPINLRFMEKGDLIKKYDKEKHAGFIENSAMMILDTSDLNYLGAMKDALKKVKEVFVFDHHEPKRKSKTAGFFDASAASTCELAIEFALSMNVELNPDVAKAAYAGIVYDSGFFAYPKTSLRTFKAAIKTIEWGVAPNQIYKHLMESSSYAAMLLQKQALLNMEFHAEKKIAVIVLRREDYLDAGAEFEEAERIVDIPIKTKEVEVSLLVKENPEGDIRCSMRSKGLVNVAKIAESFKGGGHVTAAGFTSSSSVEEVLEKALALIQARL